MVGLGLGVRVRARVRVRVRGETNFPLGRDVISLGRDVISLGRDVVSLGRDVHAARFLLLTACHTFVRKSARGLTEVSRNLGRVSTRGHHIYKSTSTPLLGEVLECKIESGNLQQLLHDLRTSSPLKIFVNGFLLDGYLLRHPVCSKVQKIRT